MEEIKSYKDCLARIKIINPDLPYKKAQKLASEIWEEEKKKEVIIPGIEADSIAPVSSKLDARLRYEASTINEVGVLLVGDGFKNFKIIKDGKKGANTLIYVELENGERLPKQGHYTVFN